MIDPQSALLKVVVKQVSIQKTSKLNFRAGLVNVLLSFLAFGLFCDMLNSGKKLKV